MQEIKCLNKGFVRLVDSMGGDDSIVQAARVSYGAGTKTQKEDKELIRYLMRHQHTSPFEMVEFKFHVKLPIFVARQWVRHRTASINEYSGRYSNMNNEFYIPELNRIKTQSKLNHQASSNENIAEKEAEYMQETIGTQQELLFLTYQNYLASDVAREIARINLPLSIFTEWYWKIDLHNLLRFLKLRLDKTAQYEIRVYAEAIMQLIQPIVPVTLQAFEDYVLNAVTFSKQELQSLKKAYSKVPAQAALSYAKNMNKTEKAEFRKKIVEYLM